MNKVSRIAMGLAVATALAAGATAASAQERSRIVASPALVKAPVAAPAAVVPTSIVIITPTPLPPRPPNFCFRGNSAGVSRC